MSATFLRQSPGKGLLALSTLFFLLMVWPVPADDEDDKRVKEQIEEVSQLLATGNTQQGLQGLDRLRQRYPDHPLVLTAVARILLMQNNAQGAIAVLNQALEKHPNHPMATASLADIELRMARGEQAQKRLDDALAVHPDSPELLLVAAQLKMMQQDIAAAQPLFQKVADNTAAHREMRFQAHSQLGTILAQQGKHPEAAETLGKALGIQWHPEVALAAADQAEKAGDVQGTLRAVNNFTMMIMYPQYAQIKGRALEQLRPIERRAKIREIEAILAEGDHTKAKQRIDSLNRELIKDAKAWGELGPQMRRVEMIQRTQLLEEGIQKGHDINWLNSMVHGIKRLSYDQQGEHMEKANAAIAKAEERINAAHAVEIPAVLELVRNGFTISDLDFPDAEMKKVLEDKGLKPYRELSVAAKTALREHFEPLAAARQAPPFEQHVLPFLENPTDGALRRTLLTSFMEHAGSFDTTAEGASRKQLVPDWVWLQSGQHGPSLPKEVADRREKAYSLWNDFDTLDLRKAGRWDEIIAGYDRIAVLYPRREVLINRAHTHIYAGNYQAAWEDMALVAAISMYEIASSYRLSAGDLQGNQHALDYLGQAQALKALAEGHRIAQGPGANAAFVDVLDDLRNGRWIKAAEFVSANHLPGSIESWYVSQLRFGDLPQTKKILDALATAAESTNDPDRQGQLVRLAEPLGSYSHPAFILIRARAEADDDSRRKLLDTAASIAPRHAETSVMLAQLMEKQGESRAALVQYNVAAMGLTVAELKEPPRQEAARQRDRLAQNLRGNVKDWDFYLSLYNEYSKEMYANQRDRRLAARTEAIMNRLLGLNANRLGVLLSRADARRFIDDYQGALDDLEEAAQEMLGHERLSIVHAGIAECHLKLANHDLAMTFFTKSIDGGHRTSYNFQKRADLHRSAGNAQAAVADYSAALEINPEDTYSLLKRSELYEYQFEDDAKALADLEKLKALNEKANRSNTVVSIRLLGIQGRILNRALR